MSKTARQGASGYRPSGRQCAECKRAAEDCSRLDFTAMPPAGKPDADGVQRVACSYYVRAQAKPCRCGPDGCADSVACPRGER